MIGKKSVVVPKLINSVDVGLKSDVRLFNRYPSPRPETTQDILRRALMLYPELAPPAVRSKKSPEVSDLVPLIVEEGCGLRPMRKGGPRIELEMMKSPKGNMVPVVHNYGSVISSSPHLNGVCTHV